MTFFRSISIALCIVCTLQQVAAFSSLSTTTNTRYTTTQQQKTSHTTYASSVTSRNLFFGAYLPLGLPVILAKDAYDNSRRTKLKEDILNLAAETKRGLIETEEQAEDMQNLFAQLEKLSPTVNPITNKNSKLNGDWSLDYTTSASILGKGGAPRIGPIIQNIDTTTLSARNSEVLRYGGIFDVPRSVSAELSPVNGKLTDVQFKRFQLGPIGFNAPESFKGSLDITYLDDEDRLTRGDKGNIFVLTRM